MCKGYKPSCHKGSSTRSTRRLVPNQQHKGLRAQTLQTPAHSASLSEPFDLLTTDFFDALGLQRSRATQVRYAKVVTAVDRRVVLHPLGTLCRRQRARHHPHKADQSIEQVGSKCHRADACGCEYAARAPDRSKGCA